MVEINLKLDEFQFDWLIMELLPSLWEKSVECTINKVELFFFDLIASKADIFKCKFCYWSDGFTGDCMIGLEPSFETGPDTDCPNRRFFKAGTGFCINEDDFSHQDDPYHAGRVEKFKAWKREALDFKKKVIRETS